MSSHSIGLLILKAIRRLMDFGPGDPEQCGEDADADADGHNFDKKKRSSRVILQTVRQGGNSETQTQTLDSILLLLGTCELKNMLPI